MDRLFALALAAVIGLAINASVPIFWVAFVTPLVALAFAVQLRADRFVPLAALAIALTPMPLIVPTLLPVGGRSLFITDLLLPAVAAWSMAGPATARKPDRVVALYGLVTALLVVIGLQQGADLSAILQDVRGPVYLVSGYLIVTRRLRWSDRRAVLITVGAILWWSAAAIGATLITGREFLHGRVGATSAFFGDSTQQLEAVRFLIASKELALVTLLAIIGLLLLSDRVTIRRRTVALLLAPAVIVVFMGFSRQSVLAVAVAVTYVLIVSPSRSLTIARMLASVVTAAFVLTFLGLTGTLGELTAEDSVVGKQVNAYSDRVLNGLFGSNVTEDPGNRFRSMEIDAAMDFVSRHPFVGGGLGTQYRGDLELEAFDDVSYGRRYVHNVYLWYAVHGGALGLGAVLLLLGRPLVTVLLPAFRRPLPRRALVLAAGAPYVGLLAIGLVEPVMHTNMTAPLMGAFLGFFALAESDRLRETDVGQLPEVPAASRRHSAAYPAATSSHR